MTDATDKVASPPSPENLGAEILRWRSHPLRRGGWRRSLVVAILILIPVGLGLLYGPFYAFLALVILAASLGTYFFPTDYAFFEGGLQSRFLGGVRRFRWEQFRSFYIDQYGVLLSPFARRSRLENFRGIFLRYDDNQGEVLAVIRDRVRAEPQSEPVTT